MRPLQNKWEKVRRNNVIFSLDFQLLWNLSEHHNTELNKVKTSNCMGNMNNTNVCELRNSGMIGNSCFTSSTRRVTKEWSVMNEKRMNGVCDKSKRNISKLICNNKCWCFLNCFVDKCYSYIRKYNWFYCIVKKVDVKLSAFLE